MILELFSRLSDSPSQENADVLGGIHFHLPLPFTKSSKPVTLVEGASAELLRVTRTRYKANRSAIVATGLILAAEQRLCSDEHWSTSNPDAALTNQPDAVAHAQGFARHGPPASLLALLAGWADVALGLSELPS